LTLAIAIVGALTGIVGLYLHWRQTRFDLRVELADLRYEPEAVEQLAARAPNDLAGTMFDFQVDLHLQNRGSGTGSIEKPRLELQLPQGKRHVIRPQIESVRSEVLERSPGFSRSRVWTERHGGSYSLGGRARCDDLIDYTVALLPGWALTAGRRTTISPGAFSQQPGDVRRGEPLAAARSCLNAARQR
jgi:hypothetical protein